jgi:hypothetical protein
MAGDGVKGIDGRRIGPAVVVGDCRPCGARAWWRQRPRPPPPRPYRDQWRPGVGPQPRGPRCRFASSSQPRAKASIDVIDEKAWPAKLARAFSDVADIDAIKRHHAALVKPQKDRVSVETWIAAEVIARDAFTRVVGNILAAQASPAPRRLDVGSREFIGKMLPQRHRSNANRTNKARDENFKANIRSGSPSSC